MDNLEEAIDRLEAEVEVVAGVPGEARDGLQGDNQLGHLRDGEEEDEGELDGPPLLPLGCSQTCFKCLANF